MSTEMSCHFIQFVASFQEISLESDFIHFFFFFFFFFFLISYMYIAPGQGQTAPMGQNFDVNRKALSLYLFVTSFQEISLKYDFIQTFFMILYMYIAPGQGQTGDKVLMSTEMSCHFIQFVASFKKTSLKSDFIYIYIKIMIS